MSAPVLQVNASYVSCMTSLISSDYSLAIPYGLLLEACSSWGRKKLDPAERLNWWSHFRCAIPFVVSLKWIQRLEMGNCEFCEEWHQLNKQETIQLHSRPFWDTFSGFLKILKMNCWWKCWRVNRHSCQSLRLRGLIAHQAPLSAGFPSKNGLPFPSPGSFLTQGSDWDLCILHCRRILHCWAAIQN